jgi:O-antigen/teichoic acid export membrane protein
VLSRELVRAGIVTYLFSALTLVANLVSGIVSARALGPSGRGVIVALVTVSQLAGWLFAAGVAQALSYFISRKPEDAPRLLTTWVLMLVPLTLLAIAVTQLLLTTMFSGDGDQAISLGRWFLFTIVLVVGLELNYGLLLGAHDFVAYNVLRLIPPALMAMSFVVLWWLDALTVTSALVAPTVATALVLVIGMVRSVLQIGVGPPDLRLGLTTLWYGIRGHGVNVAANVNARVDVAMLPAFVSVASVGLYSVATNVSLIVYQLSNTFAGLVLPAAARDSRRGPIKVVGSLYGTLVVAGALALVLWLWAQPLIEAVYGERFGDASEPLRLLLPGAVLFSGSAILSAGIYAAGRPFTATACQLIGVAVTVIGLLVFLPIGGVTAAALVSTGAYATVFVSTLVAYKTVTGIPWRRFLPTRAALRVLSR